MMTVSDVLAPWGAINAAFELNGVRPLLILVPVKDASAIERLHLDPAWARQLGLVARERAIAELVG